MRPGLYGTAGLSGNPVVRGVSKPGVEGVVSPVGLILSLPKVPFPVVPVRVELPSFVSSSLFRSMPDICCITLIFSRLFFSLITLAFIWAVILFSLSFNAFALAAISRLAIYIPLLIESHVVNVLNDKEQAFLISIVSGLCNADRLNARKKDTAIMPAEILNIYTNSLCNVGGSVSHSIVFIPKMVAQNDRGTGRNGQQILPRYNKK